MKGERQLRLCELQDLVKYIQTSSNIHYRFFKLATRRFAYNFDVTNAQKFLPNWEQDKFMCGE